MKRLMIMALVGSGIYLASGCHSCGPRQGPQSCPQPIPFPGAPTPVPVGGGAPLPKSTPWPSDGLPPPAPIGTQSKSVDPGEYPKNLSWQPGSAPSVRLYPPEVVEESTGGKKLVPVNPGPPKVEEKVTPMDPAGTAATPVGIPHFVMVRDRVANGLRPSLDDGLDWLRASGFQTVLYLHEPGAADSADRKQVEKRGMKFITMEVAPMSLSQKNIDEFNRIVGDSAVLPLFVYDRDGSLAGGMWYLNFRLTQLATDEDARAKAQPLGLREERTGAYHDMWAATQRVLNDAMR